VTLHIDKDRAIVSPSPKREIVYPKLDDLSDWIGRSRHDAPENGLTLRLYP
jgi:hypothetical protein